MSISETTIKNSVGTTLLTIAVALAGIVAFYALPVAPLPAVDFPTIQVQAQLPGASPQTMATSVGTPLERQFRPYRLSDPDDVDQFSWSDHDCAAVRSKP